MLRKSDPLRIELRKDLTRSIKRGHAWLYSHAIDLPSAPAGSQALLVDRKGKSIAAGIYAPGHPIPLRICRTTPPFQIDKTWLIEQLTRAADFRKQFFTPYTTGYRLVAGEGDGLPGLIVDVYASTAVIKIDAGGPEGFYEPFPIARWLADHLQLERVVQRFRERGRPGETLVGEHPFRDIVFLENGIQFSANVIEGQKTGFFLDQRENRHLIRQLARERSVLNLFAYNGGFSIAAGVAGATEVVSVDIAEPAIAAAEAHWRQNGLRADAHTGVALDCFKFLDDACAKRNSWDIVICDPPSFARSEKNRPQALAAYARLAQQAARVTKPGGLLALASCSSHIDHQTFLAANEDALGRARRKATLLADRGLPMDHPTPLAMPELRYLKFLLFQLD